jgi:hypothetical protein
MNSNEGDISIIQNQEDTNVVVAASSAVAEDGDAYSNYILMRHEINHRRRVFIESRLKEYFPIRYGIFYSTSLLLIGLAEIILQIFLFVNKGPLYFIGNGIWGGLACILVAILCFSLCMLPL